MSSASRNPSIAPTKRECMFFDNLPRELRDEICKASYVESGPFIRENIRTLDLEFTFYFLDCFHRHVPINSSINCPVALKCLTDCTHLTLKLGYSYNRVSYLAEDIMLYHRRHDEDDEDEACFQFEMMRRMHEKFMSEIHEVCGLIELSTYETDVSYGGMSHKDELEESIRWAVVRPRDGAEKLAWDRRNEEEKKRVVELIAKACFSRYKA